MDGLQTLYTDNSFKLRTVKFVPARRPDKAEIPEGIDLIYLNQPTQETEKNGEMPRTAQIQSGDSSKAAKELFSEDDIKREWSAICRVGAGLQNLGNTCFMNSVLQCLTHTPPLAEGLLHFQLRPGPWSMLHYTQDHIQKALQGNKSVLAPYSHFKTMRRICRSFRLGRQEDAHEYLIGLLDAMHEGQLEGVKPKPPRSIQETSMIFRIFAGRIRSQVKCIECGFESNTVDPFLDISLEINRASTLEKALQRFTATEYLEGENKYKCPRQSCLVRAAKRIAIDKAPNVLVIQFKRFEFSMYGQKIAKKVDFDTTLDMAPYMSDRRSPPKLYQLYGVLVHQGHSVHSGHYYCFVRAANGLWHQMNDNHVSQVSERMVLAQKAYILFYMRKDEALPSGIPVSPRSAWQSQSRNKAAGLQKAAADKDTSEAPLPGSRSQTKAEPQPTAKRKRGAEAAPLEAQNHVSGDRLLQQASQEATEEASAQTMMAEDFNGGLDPEALRERLQSHAAATVSGDSYKSALESPSSLGSGRARSSVKQAAGVRSPKRANIALTSPSMHQGRSVRRLRRCQLINYAEQMRRNSANSTPSLGESIAVRGGSPLVGINGSLGGTLNGQATRFKPQSRIRSDTAAARFFGLDSVNSTPEPPAERSQSGKEGKKTSAKSTLSNGMSAPATGKLDSEGPGSISRVDGPSLADKPERKSSEKKSKGPGQTSRPQNGGDAWSASPKANGVTCSSNKVTPAQPSNDLNLVRSVLGLRSSNAAGPGGEAHWDSVNEEAKQQADNFLKSLQPAQPPLDEFDQEYDRGKTKKVKGMGQQNTWDSGDRFQNAWNSKSRGRGRGNSRSNGRRTARHRS